MDGISFVVAFGAPQRPRFQRAGSFWRLVIGPVVFWLISRDFDKVVERIEATEKEISLTRRENCTLQNRVDELNDKNSRISAQYLDEWEKHKESMNFLDSTLKKKHDLLQEANERNLRLETLAEKLRDEFLDLNDQLDEANYQLQLKKKKAKKPTKKTNRKRVK